jgi:hypothetical protein
MATIPYTGLYFRTRCANCRTYFVHNNPSAATCSSSCRQRRCRAAGKLPSYPRESLGWLLKGGKVKGKLSEKVEAKAVTLARRPASVTGWKQSHPKT